MDARTNVPAPTNESVLTYAPGSIERGEVEEGLVKLAASPIDLTQTIGGEQEMGTGKKIVVVQPHAHSHVLGTARATTKRDVQRAVAAAKTAAPAWRDLPYDERAAVFLKAAELLSGPWRTTLNAATMLGQSKTVVQAEIDAACELIDFWRFNVYFGRQLIEDQPIANSKGVWNRMDHRALEGFVYAITPFNFTAIAGNLPSAPALMGNAVVWKPASTQLFSAYFIMRLLEAAGLPPGVINLVTGDGPNVSEVVLKDPDLAGVHFTGSTPVFQSLWSQVGANVSSYRTYPRLVGETGGKDFILAHSSADPDVLRTAMIRGSFEYQGQKCSASSRAYVPHSLWNVIKKDLAAITDSIRQGPVTDLSNFMGAVIDDRAFAKHDAALTRAKLTKSISVIAGGTADDSEGYFVRPTVLECSDPTDEVFTTEYFGPILAVHVYADADYDKVLNQMQGISSYALTGAIIAKDRYAVHEAMHRLRYAAGNFYVNDKPTGAVVGQQPFGGGRGSGTNDKAGAMQNLLRWTSTRSIKETFDPPTDHTYPHMR